MLCDNERLCRVKTTFAHDSVLEVVPNASEMNNKRTGNEREERMKNNGRTNVSTATEISFDL